jgi:signal transduction histidine kinase
MKKILHLLICIICCSGTVFSDLPDDIPQIVYNGQDVLDINSYIEYLVVNDKDTEINQLVNRKFIRNNRNQINFGNIKGSLWIRFRIINKSTFDTIKLRIANPILNWSKIYVISDSDTVVKSCETSLPINKRDVRSTDHIYRIYFGDAEEFIVYLNVRNQEQMLVPMRLETTDYNRTVERAYLLINGIYIGLIGGLFLYNLFLLVTIRDNAYLWYVIHTLFVGVAQSSFNGFHLFYFSSSPFLIEITPTLFSALASISGIQFMITFLDVKSFNKNYYFILKLFIYQYLVNSILTFFSFVQVGYQILLPAQGFVASIILFISANMAYKGIRSAKFYLIAWSLFMIGIFVFAMKDFGVLPYNNFTKYTMFIGSGIEVLLLSFALADKIKVLQREKEFSQLQALLKAEENERLIREQNILLEDKVQKRTEQLTNANKMLEKALQDLKDAQSQLVDKEKMASLGQLTAGIAHEINNPINFISSGIKPLKMDIEDLLKILDTYKELFDHYPEAEKVKKIKESIDYHYVIGEIEELLNGIEEGAKRTTEIVVGLRTFSRLDEDTLKYTNINENLDATIVLLNNKLKSNINVVKNYCNESNLECYPGKLNQVFMNILSNAIDAIKEKFPNGGGEIKINTYHDEDYFVIEFSDNGIGMKEEVKKRIFEPFFTTKKVGEGTGLGMSIVYKIIEKHHGKIEVSSDYGVGTTFKLYIYKKLNEPPEIFVDS